MKKHFLSITIYVQKPFLYKSNDDNHYNDDNDDDDIITYLLSDALKK